jgi:hypothetical protein
VRVFIPPGSHRLVKRLHLCVLQARHRVFVSDQPLCRLIVITYLFVLFIVTFTHSRTQPTIWSAAICSVPWFTRGESDARGDVSCRPDEKNDSQQFSYLNKGDVDAPPDLPQKADGQGELPLWARRLHVRRGIDPPFAASSLTTPSARGSSATATAPAPLPSAPTQQSKLAQPHGSRFIERFQESNFEPPVPWWETPAQYGLQFTPHTEVFPHKVDDHDSPIPLPHLSEWIRADAVPRIDAHVSTPPVTFP